MAIFDSMMVRELLKEYILAKYGELITSGGDIQRNSINRYIHQTIDSNPTIAENLMKLYGYSNLVDFLSFLTADTFKAYERFLRGNLTSSTEITLQKMCIAFNVPGWEKLIGTSKAVVEEENIRDTSKLNYMGYFFSDRYKLKKCLLEINESDNSVNLYYVELKDDGSSEIKNGDGEYYTGTIEGNRAITLHKGNQFSHIILSEDYHLLSEAVEKLNKYQAISALWQKERLKIYETSSNLLLKKIKEGNFEIINNCSISLAEISKLLSWRYDKLPYKLNNEKYKEEVRRKSVILNQLPGEYEIYQYLTVKKFSRFILEISDNLEISLKTSLHQGAIEKRGYMKVYSGNCNPIILHFPPIMDDEGSSQDYICMALNRDYRNNKIIMTGSIWEINNGKPFCGKIYTKKIVKSANRSIPEWLEIKDILSGTHNENEYPGFIDFFLGNSKYHNCMVSYDAYDELKKEVEQFKKNKNEQ